MGINSLIRYVTGNITFCAQNGFIERLINLCANNNIILWDFHKNDEGFTARCSAKNYEHVKQMAQKVNVEISIQKKHGLVFKLKKYRKRWGIILGFLIFLIFIFLSQYFVWKIDIMGNTTVPDSVILSELSELGIHKLSFIPSIDFKLKKQQALLKLPQLSWLAINQKGCKLIVDVTERCMPPPIKENTPCNIVAAKTGQIIYMEVYNGQIVKGLKYPVNKGDIIVSGMFTTKQGETILVHADAKIIAQVQFDKTISLDLNQVSKKYTGKTKTHYFLNLFSFKIPLFIAFPLKGNYDVSVQSNPITLFEKELPIGIDSIHYTFYDKISEHMNKEEARKVLKGGFLKYEASELFGTAILKRTVKETLNDGILTMTTSYVAEQNIAKKVSI